MKNAVFGVLAAAAGVLSVIPGAQAQPYGYGFSSGYGPPPGSSWEREDWERRMERREHRREFWRQQRELAERRAYEAGQRDAYPQQRYRQQPSGWVDR